MNDRSPPRRHATPTRGQEAGREREHAQPRSPRTDRREAALVYVQKLTKVYPIRRGLWRRHQLLHALNGVSFYIRRRETFGLVGESGSGKSTLGRCIIRLTEPTVGRIIFDRKDLTRLGHGELRAMRQRMQIVFQNPYSSLDPHMTVEEIVREGIDVFRLAKTRADARGKVADLLGQVGLGAELGSRYPHELSGGQRQRVAIARALAVKPDFIVLDEPLSALDVSVQAQIMNLLDDLQQDLGLTLLFISHDLRAARYMSHRLGVLYRGKLVEVGPTVRVARRCGHPYSRALFDAVPQAPGSAERVDRGSRVIDGEPPPSTEAPEGCVFFHRCDRAEPGKCDAEEPPLGELETGSQHRVACWHPLAD